MSFTTRKSIPISSKKRARKTEKTVTRASVEKMILNRMEPKRWAFDSSKTMLGNTYGGENLMYWIPQGTNDSSRIGDQVYLDYFEIAFNFSTNNQTQDVNLYYAVVMGLKETFTGSLGFDVGANTNLDIRFGANSWVSNPVVDTNQWKVLKSRMVRIPKLIAGGTGSSINTHNGKLIVPIKRNFEYKTGTAGFAGLRNRNYYVVWAYDTPTGGIGTCQMDIDGIVHFKDA